MAHAPCFLLGKQHLGCFLQLRGQRCTCPMYKRMQPSPWTCLALSGESNVAAGAWGAFLVVQHARAVCVGSSLRREHHNLIQRVISEGALLVQKTLMDDISDLCCTGLSVSCMSMNSVSHGEERAWISSSSSISKECMKPSCKKAPCMYQVCRAFLK